MASGPHTFAICSVFSPERFKGNPLAIVAVRGNALSQQRKSLIAKEFGYSETIFIHDAPSPNLPRRIDIFTEHGEEIPFAGHPTIGAAHYIFTVCERLGAETLAQGQQARRQTATIMTKAGPIPITYDPRRQVAACNVPINFHVHKNRISIDQVLSVQPQIQIVPTIDKVREKAFPVISVVHGMTFGLIDLSDAPEILSSLKKSEAPEVSLDEEWSPSFVGCLYYKKRDSLVQENEPTIHAVQARMITQGFEDPGTGSACTGLACYLALEESGDGHPVKSNSAGEEAELVRRTEEVKLEHDDQSSQPPKLERHIYAITQGVEMGRVCTIAMEVAITVQTDGTRRIANVALSGRASFFAKGELMP